MKISILKGLRGRVALLVGVASFVGLTVFLTNQYYHIQITPKSSKVIELDKTEANEKVEKFYNTMKYLKGSFLAKASIDERYRENRIKELGYDGSDYGTPSLTFSHNLDKDPQLETLEVYFNQMNYMLRITDNGHKRSFWACMSKGDIDNPPGGVEVALKDFDGDGISEIWVVGVRFNEAWPKFCMLKYNGIGKSELSSRTIQDPNVVDVLVSNTAGWGVTSLVDNTIEMCGGSGCAQWWKYKFQNGVLMYKDSSNENFRPVDKPVSGLCQSPSQLISPTCK